MSYRDIHALIVLGLALCYAGGWIWIALPSLREELEARAAAKDSPTTDVTGELV